MPTAPCCRANIARSTARGCCSSEQILHLPFDLLDRLVELVELRLQRDPRRPSRQVVLGRVQRQGGAEAVAGQVAEIGRHVQLEELHVQVEQLVAGRVGSGVGVVWMA